MNEGFIMNSLLELFFYTFIKGTIYIFLTLNKFHLQILFYM